MILTAKMKAHGRLSLALILALSLLLGGVAHAQSATTLTVQVKGVRYEPAKGWQSAVLSAPVDVFSTDGTLLGNVTAGARGADTLTLSGVSAVVLKPAEGATIDGYVFAGESRATLTQGQTNLATVFAYAQQGLLKVQNVLTDTGEGVVGSEFEVLDAAGKAVLSFAIDETGMYLATELLPSGAYTLTQTRAATGTRAVEPIGFTVGTYFGREKDIASVIVESELAPGAEGLLVVLAATPTVVPEGTPTVAPTEAATAVPTVEPTAASTAEPAAGPTAESIAEPTVELTAVPTVAPTAAPTAVPTAAPTATPTATPTIAPTATPVAYTSIEGYAYLDSNGDGAQADGDPLITGVPLLLQRLDGESWTDAASAETDSYGRFAFAQLEPGQYRLAARTDAEGYYVASVGAGAQGGENGLRYGDAFALEGGQSVADGLNVRLLPTASLAFSAFLDNDQNGARANGEKGVASVKVEVLDGETVVATGLTDESGALTLPTVLPGEHTLRVSLPVGYAFTALGADSAIGGVPGTSAVIGPIAFQSGQSATAGAGLVAVGSFSGKVFEDVNDNGTMEDDEPGVAGVLLRLVGKRSGQTYELTSDDTGIYCFNSLPSDTYFFTATLPEGMLLARYSKTGGDLRSVFTGSTTQRQYSVSVDNPAVNKNVGVIERGGVAGTAFTDLNYNGVWDDGEPGYAGLTVELIKVSTSESAGRAVSDADGAYSFSGLRGGVYRLRAILPDDGASEFTKTASGEKANLFEQRDGRRENSLQPVEIVSGQVTQTLVGVAIGAKIEGVVYQDDDYSGAQNGKEKLFSGVKVRLADASGAIVATDTTNAAGAYTLSGVMPGTYVVEVQRKAGYGFTRIRPDEARGNCVVELLDDYGVTAPLTVTMGQDIGNINAGMLPASKVSGTLFHDADDDGLRGEGENGLTGVTVRLLSSDGEIDLTRSVSEDGSYFFDGVMPGSYTLTYTLPEHVELAAVAPGGNTLEGQGQTTTTAPFDVLMGEDHILPLVGAVTLGSLEGYVFHDSDASGTVEDGESRLSGAVVTLAPARAGLEKQSATTGKDGAFSLTGLRPSDYQLTIELPDGYILSHDLGDIKLAAARQDTADCPWSALISRETKLVGAVKPASVSGAIWLDENKDAARGDETLLSGVTVELVSAVTGYTAQRVSSTDQGYAFASVRPGRYKLRFALPVQSEPANETGSAFRQNGSYMVCDDVLVTEGAEVGGLDTGLVSKTSVGGNVWLEENGAATPISGMTISLYIAGQESALMTTTTSGAGAYRFDGLWPGEYTLRASLPEGMIFVRPDDQNYQPGASAIVTSDVSGGASEPFTLEMAQHQLSRSIILIKPAKIGDQAWLDENQNGLVDAGEPMLPGVTVRLKADGQAAYETKTDAFGYYEFTDVYPGTYTLEAVAYSALDITKSVPSLRMISSCLTSGDGDGAQSDAFEAVSGVSDMNFDLGYVLKDGQTLPQLEQAPAKDWTGANTPDIVE